MYGNRSDEGPRGEVAGRSCDDKKKELLKKFYQDVIQHSQCRVRRSFLAGSTCEIPFQEFMFHKLSKLSDLLDADYMHSANFVYVTTRRDTVPDQFNGPVLSISSRGLHAGYVKLFYEDVKTEFKRADMAPVVFGNVLRGPANTMSIANHRKSSNKLKKFISEKDWMANLIQSKVKMMEDNVYAVHSKYWPLELNEWITRRRLSGLPSKSIIKQVVQYGCDFVQVSHKLSTDENEWRFSFSKAELIIIHSWTTSQRCVYRTLHALSKIIKSSREDSKLSTYYFKALMLWATEEKPAEFWSECDLVKSVCKLLCDLKHWLQQRFCPNYFIPTNNMLDHLTGTELSHDIDDLHELLDKQDQIANFLCAARFTEAYVSNAKYYIKVPVCLYTSLLIMEQLDYCEDRSTRLFTESSSALIERTISTHLSNTCYGLYYYILAGNSLIQSDNFYLTKSIEHFYCNGVSHLAQDTVVSCSSAVARHYTIGWFMKYKSETNLDQINMQYKSGTSESHSFTMTLNKISADIWSVLNGDNNQTDEKCFLCSQLIDNVGKKMTTDIHFNENIYGNNRTTVTVYMKTTVDNIPYASADFYKKWTGMTPTVNISWFINRAYVANLYYITRRDYRATKEMCDYIIHVSTKSYFNQWLAEYSLQVVLSTEWTSVYDKELQAMLGLYSLCSFMFNKTDRSRPVCLGVCPVLFALYLKCRCAADQMDIERWHKCLHETFKHFKECKGDTRVNIGRRAVCAFLKVIVRTLKPLST